MSSRPLRGQRVVVTRAAHQAGELVTALEAAGAEVARLPLLELGPPPEPEAVRAAARRSAELDWLAFTSANAVHAFLPLLEPPVGPRIAVVGPATAAAVKSHGCVPALTAVSPRASGRAERLLQRLAAAGETRTARVLVPPADDARPELVDRLRAAGVAVEAPAAYSKRLPAGAAQRARQLLAGRPLGWVTVTSPRIARHLVELCSTVLGGDWPRRRGELRAVSIGPVTSAELRRLELEPAIEAERPSAAGLVAALARGVAAARRRV